MLLKCQEEAQDLWGGLWSQCASPCATWGAVQERQEGEAGDPRDLLAFWQLRYCHPCAPTTPSSFLSIFPVDRPAL